MNRARLLHETLRRYLRRQAWSHLEKVLAKTRDEELAEVMRGLSEGEQDTLFRLLPDDARRAKVICEMRAPFGQRVLGPLPPDEAASILSEMAPDDMADILADLDSAQAAAIIEILEEGDEVEDLMRYGDETAGGIMIPEFLALAADATAEEAVVQLRESADVEMVYYVYVVNEHGHLVGVLSMRRLVTAPPATRVSDVMETDVISVTTDTDQEDVAQIAARYSFLSVPVVDDANRLVGIVTVDDVIDVLRDEATEDILKMAGAGNQLSETTGIRNNVRVRFPWLLASCFGGLVAAAVMGLYDETLQAHSFLAHFLPIVLGMSGNVGTQSATVVVRSLAVGRISRYDNPFGVVQKEILVGLTLGCFYGVLVGVVALFLGDGYQYAVSIGISVVAGMTFASAVGAGVPMVLNRAGVDPAVATGPFVTTSIDVLGVAGYFAIAALMLRWFTMV